MSYFGELNTGGTKISQGTTGERLSFEGNVRINTTTGLFEYYNSGSWLSPSGAPSGSSGYIQFNNGSGGLNGDAQLFWDNINKDLIVGGGTAVDTTLTPITLNANQNAYMSYAIKNASATALAAGDFTAYRNDGTTTTNFAAFGINSSVYNDPTYPIQSAGSGYAFVNGGNFVLGTQTAHDVIFHTGGTALTDRALVIKGGASDKGYVGFLEGSSSNPTLLGKIHIINEDDSKSSQFIDRYSTSISPLLVIRRARGTFASPTAVQSGDGLGGLSARGYGATGFSSGSRTLILSRANENWTDSAQGTNISFQTTNNGGTTLVESFLISSSGSTFTQAIQSTTSTFITFTQAASTGGNQTGILYTGGASTGLTASAEIIDVNYNLARTIQRATGAVTTQRAYLVQAPTYSFVGASTITDAATVAISGAPVAGTNATITRTYAFWVQSGNARVDGNITSRGGARTWGTEDGQTLAFQTNGTTRWTITSTGAHTITSSALNGTALATFTQAVSTSGNTPFITFTAAAHTAQTASAETIDINFNLSGALQHATGALTTQRSFVIQARTYSFVAASTITNAATLAITAAPIAGTNATITNAWTLWIQAGNSRFDGTEVQIRHLRGTTTAPTIAAGTGAGTTPTVSVTGTDIAGLVNITTGTTPTGTNAIVATITFNTAYTTAPYVILIPANRNAQALAIGSIVLVPAAGQTNGVTTTTFVIESGATALAASTAYIWSYQVIQ